jgi:hypothetical protein
VTISSAELHALAERYCHGEISADKWFAACDQHAREMVELEIQHEQERRHDQRRAKLRRFPWWR